MDFLILKGYFYYKTDWMCGIVEEIVKIKKRKFLK